MLKGLPFWKHRFHLIGYNRRMLEGCAIRHSPSNRKEREDEA